MGVPIYHVDAFALGPFSGNPAAVCLLDRERDDRWLQSFASDMNLSETAYLLPRPDGFALRWFTPAVEVALCGHATLASAHVLWETGRLSKDQDARFHTLSGLLTSRHSGDLIEMDFPATPASPVDAPEGLFEALGITPHALGKTAFDFLIELDSADEVCAVRPDFGRLKSMPVRGIMVTSRSDTPEYDFISRFFAPGSGVDEDPATGSAHCCLGPYWTEKLGKDVLNAYQASPRGGTLQVTVRGDRVVLAGRAFTILKGELCI